MSANGNASDCQLVPPPEVRLSERADRPAAEFLGEFSRGCACSAFEFIAQHTCPATYITFCNRTGLCRVQGFHHMLGPDEETVDIVEPAVCGLGYQRAGPTLKDRVLFHLPFDDGIAYNSDAVCVRDPNRPFKKAAFLQP